MAVQMGGEGLVEKVGLGWIEVEAVGVVWAATLVKEVKGVGVEAYLLVEVAEWAGVVEVEGMA